MVVYMPQVIQTAVTLKTVPNPNINTNLNPNLGLRPRNPPPARARSAAAYLTWRAESGGPLVFLIGRPPHGPIVTPLVSSSIR